MLYSFMLCVCTGMERVVVLELLKAMAACPVGIMLTHLPPQLRTQVGRKVGDVYQLITSQQDPLWLNFAMYMFAVKVSVLAR